MQFFVFIFDMAINKEELFVIVQKYSVLYDKSHKEFHRNDVKKNAWDAVANDIGFENGKDNLFIELVF